MTSNKYQAHVLVLPEDDANRQIALGFRLDSSVETRKLQVLPVAGGWKHVLDLFVTDHIANMYRRPSRSMVLLIDFDGRQDRFNLAKTKVPQDLSERVFVLGVLTEPEALKKEFGSYEIIGTALAKDCREETNTIWNHHLLQHNSGEFDRMRKHVRPILFASS